MPALQPSLFETAPAGPAGLRYAEDVIAPELEAELVAGVAALPLTPFEFHGYLGKRRVAYFGLRYDFDRGAVEAASPLPEFLEPARAAAAAFANISPDAFAHALVTEYAPGAAIGWHRDRPQFGQVVGLSLLSPCRFRLRRRCAGGGFERAEFTAAPRSAYLLSGPVRSDWEHSIPPVPALRYSVTFRTLREGGSAP